MTRDGRVQTFRDRRDAGRQLAEHLRHLYGSEPIVLGIVRGGMPVAVEVAACLEGRLGAIWVKKLGAPGNPEYALGAISDQGDPVFSEPLSVNQAEVQAVVQRRLHELEQWRRRFGENPLWADCKGRIVVVCDDGMATGSSMRAALRRVRTHAPARLVAAVPVAPLDTVQRMSAEADEMITVLRPADFYAVGAYYEDFRPVSDDEVADYLRTARR